MSSRGVASFNESGGSKPAKSSLPTPFVQGFRHLLAEALNTVDPESGKKLGSCIGVYAFFDYDGEPIYVGQTTEDFATRVGRHLRGQRSDTIAYRILDPFEVAKMRLYPLESARTLSAVDKRAHIDGLEHAVYSKAIDDSKYHAILNEKLPPTTGVSMAVPESHEFNLVPEEMREEREHPDVRIARRAETLARVSAVAHERGEVSEGLRRVLIVQAVRLADLAAARLAYVEGRPGPSPDSINMTELIGSVRPGDNPVQE